MKSKDKALLIALRNIIGKIKIKQIDKGEELSKIEYVEILFLCSKQLKDFLAEVKGIMDSFQDYKVHVWSFDTKVHNPEVFTPDKDITDYKPKGFGGTEFESNFEWMKEEGLQPKKLIVFTDGYPWGSWGDENYCDTLWVIHGNHDKDLEAPFGVTTHYEAETE